MENIIQTLSESFHVLTDSPSWLVLLVVINLICVWLQTSAFCANKFVPAIAVVIGAVLWSFLGDCGAIAPTQRHPQVILAMQGFLIGVIAYALHGSLVAFWRKKFPDETPSINPLKN
jgi:hypothetical protein